MDEEINEMLNEELEAPEGEASQPESAQDGSGESEETPAPEQGVESAEQESTEESLTPKVKPYTDEEFETLEAEQVDPERLTKAQMFAYKKAKSLEAGYTKKFQALAAREQELINQTQPKQQAPTPKDIYEAFDRDPDTVMAQLDTLIGEKSGEDYAEALKLQNLKLNLISRKQDMIARGSRIAEIQAEVQAETLKAIPDYGLDLVQKLSDYAMTTLGYTEDELMYMTNPGTVGRMAVKNIKAIHEMWKKSEAEKTASKSMAKKTVKKATSVEPAGSGFEKAPKKTWTAQDAISELEASQL